MTPSLLRLAEHDILSKISLSGKVLDLGGVRQSEYSCLISGDHIMTIVNLDTETKPDVFHNLEEPLPFADGTYDHILLINVLEHVFNYRQLLNEAARVVSPGGLVVIVVPFLFPFHPSPHDYWRFSKETLEKECKVAGLRVSSIQALGSGVFAARYVMLDRLLPGPIRSFSFYTGRYIAAALDRLFVATSCILRKKYSPADYALGFVVTASK